MRKEIPKKCPLLNGCFEYVDKDTFEILCDNDGWITCIRAKYLAKRMGFLKKPREWIKELDEDKDK